MEGDLVEQIKPSVGMRNAIVHEYVKVDYSIVAAEVPMAIEAYSEYRRVVAAFAVAHANAENWSVGGTVATTLTARFFALGHRNGRMCA
jgi:hypothetical protein